MKTVSITANLLIVHYFVFKFVHSLSDGNLLSAERCDQNCFSIVTEILQVSQAFHSTGQILVSREWFLSVNQAYLKRLHRESWIPWLVYGGKQVAKNATLTTPISIIPPNKFTSSKFAHLHHSSFLSSSSSLQFLNAQRQQTWRKLLYLTFREGVRIHYSELDGSSDSSRKAGLAAAWNAFIQKDLFIVTFDLVQLLSSVTSKKNTIDNDLILLHNRKIHSISKYTIWIGCSHSSDKPASKINTSHSTTTFPVDHTQQLCIYSSRKGFPKLLGHIAHCKDSSLTMHIDRFHQLLADHSVGSGHRNVHPIKRHVAELSMTGHEERDLSPAGITRHKIDTLSRKGFLYSSLVFITKRLPEAHTSSNVWGPFTIASWIGILAAYTLTAIVFALIKIITMHNLENSWYECLFTQLVTLMSEEKASLPHEQRDIITSISSSTVGLDVIDENDNYEQNLKRSNNFLQVTHGSGSGVQLLETRRISVKSLTVPREKCSVQQQRSCSTVIQENQTTFVQAKYNHTRGKLSRTILYGTIRLVSFVLLAMYEGKLYNTITFPKSKLVATFDELISSDKYFIKVSSEAAKLENITSRIKGNLTFGKPPPDYVTVKETGENSNGLPGPGSSPTDKFVESVNILDCVNWVESAPDPNHACVGYEFELRNLHKAQKSDKILVRSKYKLMRFGSGGTASVVVRGGSTSASARFLSRRRGFTLFPGGLQISKWILESGILQLWSIVENAFMESVINPNWKDPFKVFTIRDYLGLFVVYSMLLILATIMFLLEHIVSALKKIASTKKVQNFLKLAWSNCKVCGNGWRRIVSFCSCTWCSDTLALNWYRHRKVPKLYERRSRKYFRGWSAANGSAV